MSLSPNEASALNDIEHALNKKIVTKRTSYDQCSAEIQDGHVIGLDFGQEVSWKNNPNVPKQIRLPDSLGNLDHLSTLKINLEQLEYLPASLGNCTRLEKLHVNCKNLPAFPESMANLVNLKKIHLVSRNATTIPEAIGNLAMLESLHLSMENLVKLPQSIGNCRQLKELWITGASRRCPDLPETLKNCTSLEELGFDGVALTSLPDFLVEIRSLRKLAFINVAMNDLPENLWRFTQLTQVLWRTKIDNKDHQELLKVAAKKGWTPHNEFIGQGFVALMRALYAEYKKKNPKSTPPLQEPAWWSGK
nr:leucine-rich repeat domain-containing protein [Candidatus Sigynarchaeota archaeon]